MKAVTHRRTLLLAVALAALAIAGCDREADDAKGKPAAATANTVPWRRP